MPLWVHFPTVAWSAYYLFLHASQPSATLHKLTSHSPCHPSGNQEMAGQRSFALGHCPQLATESVRD